MFAVVVADGRRDKTKRKIFSKPIDVALSRARRQHEATTERDEHSARLADACSFIDHNRDQCSRMRCDATAPAARLQCACSGPVHAVRASL
ncbi:hypothetical protein [Bifidobacterium castoris]|uniref:hypothetical protein n=1 Tax=Bifidobacterium castoris TaxID=2306972 RepID=UPI000F7E747F|nr:hypothetical protein [Bifidobacterium castoris]